MFPALSPFQCQQEAAPTGEVGLRPQALEPFTTRGPSPARSLSHLAFLCLNSRLYLKKKKKKQQGKLPVGPLWPQQGCFPRWTNWLVLIPSSSLPFPSLGVVGGKAEPVVRQGVGGVGALRGGEASWQQMEVNEWGLGAPCAPQ